MNNYLLRLLLLLQTKKFADIIIPRGAENFGIYFKFCLSIKIYIYKFILIFKTNLVICKIFTNVITNLKNLLNLNKLMAT